MVATRHNHYSYNKNYTEVSTYSRCFPLFVWSNFQLVAIVLFMLRKVVSRWEP